VDGPILTDKIRQIFGGKKQVVSTPGETDGDEHWLDDPMRRLDPASVAKVWSSW
jgi:hypothetical protein